MIFSGFGCSTRAHLSQAITRYLNKKLERHKLAPREYSPPPMQTS